MQKRETGHRRRRRLRNALAAAILAVVTLAAGLEAAGLWVRSVRPFDAGPLELAPLFVTLETRREPASGAVVHTSVTDPYFLEGLASAELLAGFEGRRCSAGLGWRHLSHALYREDRLAVSLGMRMPRSGLRLFVVPAVERSAVRGFRATAAHSLSISASYESARGVCAGFTRAGSNHGAGALRGDAAFVELTTSSLTAAVERRLAGPRSSDTRLAVVVPLDRRCAIAFAYRWESGEVAGGVAVELSRVLVDISWSEHPALGGTLAAGVGRRWPR